MLLNLRTTIYITAFIFCGLLVWASTQQDVQAISVEIAEGSSSPSSNKFFVPDNVTVGKGETVTWTNKDSTLHTVTSGTPEGTDSGVDFDSSYMAGGKKFRWTFDIPGTFDYYCTLHPFMTGTVNVLSTPTMTSNTSQSITAEPFQNLPDTITINATMREGNVLSSNLYFQNASIKFGKGNEICPDNNCLMEFNEATFNKFGQDRYISGMLKVQNKTNSDPSFNAFDYYKISGTFHLTSSKENVKTNEKILFYEGTFGIDKESTIYPEFSYESTAKLAGNTFELSGSQ